MNFKIIQVTSENTDILGKIADDVFDEDIKPALLAAYLADPKNFMFVAIVDGLVVGQARGIHHLQPDRKTEFYVDNLGVDPAYQRNGIATALMKALLVAGTGEDVEDVWLATERENEQAIGFYRNMGLLETKVVMFANFVDD